MGNKKRKQGGFSLVEILVSIGVFAAIVFAAVGVFIVSQESVQIARTKTHGIFHLKDYIEKVKNIKRYDWLGLVNGRYIFVDTMGNWVLQTTTTGETIGTFTRYVDIADGRRDIDGDLLLTGGSVDPSTKLVTVTVSWTGIKAGSVSESVYITRYLDNLPWTVTTETEFEAGTHSGTNTQLTGSSATDAEVVLGAGGGASWCAPELVIAGVNLDGSGVAKAVTAIEGKAFVGTGDNASGWTFSNVNISNVKPPVGTVNGYYNDGGVKGNDVFGETNYGYVATDTNGEEVIILNTASLPFTKVGYFDIPGNTDANSIFVYGNTGYTTAANNRLYNFNLTSKSVPPSRPAVDPDGVALSGIGTAVVVSGDYAYVTTNNADSQLQIVDLTTPTNMTVISSVNLDAAGATDVYINSSVTRAYVVTSASATQKEFFVINIETKSTPFLITNPVEMSYDTNGMSPRGVEIVPGGRAIVVGTGGLEYQVLNISNETVSPSSCVTGGGLNVDSGIYDSASILEADNDAYTYIVTGDASAELRIIEGGPGGQFSTSGRWESATFDADNSASFNRFYATFDKPILATMRFQVSVVDPGVSGNCTDAVFNDFTFVGPDGTAATYFTEDGAVPIDDTGINFENPGRCARIRAYLETTDFSQSPTLFDVSVNYSP